MRFDDPADAAKALAAHPTLAWPLVTPLAPAAPALTDGEAAPAEAVAAVPEAADATVAEGVCTVELVVGEEEVGYWANIDAMHRQKLKDEAGKGKGKGKGKSGKGGKGGKGKGKGRRD